MDRDPEGIAQQTRRLLDVAHTLASDLDLDAVLDRVLQAAAGLTGARYAALGVLDEAGTALERFLTLGVDEETHVRIGDLPRGRGVLGELIHHPEPIRLTHIGAHPRSFGFPSGRPPMRTFLGVPIIIRGRPSSSGWRAGSRRAPRSRGRSAA